MKISQKIAVAAVALFFIAGAVFFGYKTYKANEIETYLGQVSEIQRKLAIEMQPLKFAFNQTDLNPKAASYLKPKLSRAVKLTKNAMSEAKELDPPSRYIKDHKDLVLRLTKANQAYKDLYYFSDYLVERNKYLKQIVSGLENFQKKIRKAKSNEQVSELCKTTGNNLEKQLNGLKKIKDRQNLIKNELLSKYCNELTKDLRGLSSAINENDYEKYYNSIKGIRDVFSQDWTNAFTETDKKELKKLLRRIDDLSS